MDKAMDSLVNLEEGEKNPHHLVNSVHKDEIFCIHLPLMFMLQMIFSRITGTQALKRLKRLLSVDSLSLFLRIFFFHQKNSRLVTILL